MYRKTIGVYLFIILIVYLRKEIAGGALRLLYLFLNCKRVCSKFNMALKQKWTLFFLKDSVFYTGQFYTSGRVHTLLIPMES